MTALIKEYGITEAAIRVAVSKFVEQAEKREKLEAEIKRFLH